MADYLDDLMNANQELGDENNIFGGNNSAIDAMVQIQQKSGTNVIDYQSYADQQHTEKVDYDKLTKISDKDEYHVVSVQETVIRDDGNGANVTKQTIQYQPNGNNTDTAHLQVAREETEDAGKMRLDSDVEAELIETLQVVIENDDTLNLQGISGNTTLRTVQSLNQKLKQCTFYDEDGYEISNLNAKIEAVAEIDGDKFVLNAKLRAQSKAEQHAYNNTVVVKNELDLDSDSQPDSPKEQAPLRADAKHDASGNQEKQSQKAKGDSKNDASSAKAAKSNVQFGGNNSSEPAPPASNSGGCCIVL
mmetsp:Transcript_58375/g.92779  ORF Transcript_58375/g.92779 Transcript_58375/m.92779 type:complete len:305 (+) Transcript_58375:48-962(+)